MKRRVSHISFFDIRQPHSNIIQMWLKRKKSALSPKTERNPSSQIQAYEIDAKLRPKMIFGTDICYLVWIIN